MCLGELYFGPARVLRSGRADDCACRVNEMIQPLLFEDGGVAGLGSSEQGESVRVGDRQGVAACIYGIAGVDIAGVPSRLDLTPKPGSNCTQRQSIGRVYHVAIVTVAESQRPDVALLDLAVELQGNHRVVRRGVITLAVIVFARYIHSTILDVIRRLACRREHVRSDVEVIDVEAVITLADDACIRRRKVEVAVVSGIGIAYRRVIERKEVTAVRVSGR